jgi:hypothetical protein
MPRRELPDPITVFDGESAENTAKETPPETVEDHAEDPVHEPESTPEPAILESKMAPYGYKRDGTPRKRRPREITDEDRERMRAMARLGNETRARNLAKQRDRASHAFGPDWELKYTLKSVNDYLDGKTESIPLRKSKNARRREARGNLANARVTAGDIKPPRESKPEPAPTRESMPEPVKIVTPVPRRVPPKSAPKPTEETPKAAPESPEETPEETTPRDSPTPPRKLTATPKTRAITKSPHAFSSYRRKIEW